MIGNHQEQRCRKNAQDAADQRKNNNPEKQGHVLFKLFAPDQRGHAARDGVATVGKKIFGIAEGTKTSAVDC